MSTTTAAAPSGPGRVASAGAPLVPATAAIAVLALAVGATLRIEAPHDLPWLPLVATGGLFLLYLGGSALVLRAPVAAGTALAVLGGVLLQVVAVGVRPRATDDFLRYAWDGRVQAAGIDPYRYPPGAPELAGLRDAWLFPGGVTALNHPEARTIYPPVAQAWFWVVHVVSGGRGEQRPLQVAMAALAVATSVALVVVLRRTGSDPRLVVWWAWCPTVVLEAGNNAHVDVLGSLLVVATMGALAARRWVGAGVLLGLAVAAKLLPAVVAVSVPPRRSLRVGLAAAGALALVYLPHVVVLGADVTGFLGGYVEEESHGRFRVLKALLPDDALATVAAVVVLAATALLVWRDAERREAAADPPRPWHGAAVMVGVTLVVLTPSYSWYALLLVPLVALGARPAWLWVVAAGYPVYSGGILPTGHQGTRAWSYSIAATLVVVAFLRARHRARRGPRAVRARPVDVDQGAA